MSDSPSVIQRVSPSGTKLSHEGGMGIVLFILHLGVTTIGPSPSPSFRVLDLPPTLNSQKRGSNATRIHCSIHSPNIHSKRGLQKYFPIGPAALSSCQTVIEKTCSPIEIS